MEEELALLKQKVAKLEENSVKPKKEKTSRAPSEYNKYMSSFIATQKAKDGEKYDHKLAFKMGAESWKKSKGKPKE